MSQNKELPKNKEFIGPLLNKERVKRYARSVLKSNKIKKVYLPFIDEILKRVKKKPEMILDLGTGPGFLALEFARKVPEAKVFGLDLSEDMLAYAKRVVQESDFKNVTLVLGDVQEIPFEDDCFDLIVSHGLIKCVPDFTKALKEVYRVLKSGGFAFLVDVRRDALKDLEKITSQLNSEEYAGRKKAMENALSFDEVRDLLIKSGLESQVVLEKKPFKFQIVISKSS